LKLQDYNFLLWYISGKINTKAAILSRKDQMDTKDNNKDVQMLKEELWSRRQMMIEITVLWRSQVREETTLMKKIWWNRIREQEVIKELAKKDSQSWKDKSIVYVEERIYITNNKKIQEQILQKNHDPVDIGHLRQKRMIELIKTKYNTKKRLESFIHWIH